MKPHLCLCPGLIVASLLAPPGCASISHLNGMPDPSAILTIAPQPRPMLHIMLVPSEKGFQTPCRTWAPEAKGTLNGTPMLRLRGVVAHDDMSYDRDCSVDFLADSAAIARNATAARIAISDASAAWTIDLPEAFTPRMIAIVSPRDGIIRAGQTIVVRWSPPTDRLEGRAFDFELRGKEPAAAVSLRVTGVSGDEISAAVPTRGLPPPGPGVLTFRGTALVKPAIARCPVAGCSTSMTMSVQPLPITIGN
jgi:hypothetical protein